MAKITIMNRNTQEKIELEDLSYFEAQFLADLVSGSWAYGDWDYQSPDTYPERQIQK